MLSFQKGKPYAASWPCDEAPRSNILRGSKTSNARTGSFYSIWPARMVALPKWRWASCAMKRKERISSASFSNLAWPTRETAARCYGFDLDALRPIADKIGPTPADLGQDPSLVTTAEEIRRAEWWKDEYNVQWGG